MENLLLLLAAVLCGSSAILSLIGPSQRFKKLAAILWCLSVLMIVSAVTLMLTYLITSKFEYQYIYSHSSLDTGLLYKISSLWSGQEGSFLLWALLLGLMGFFVLRLKGTWAHRALGIYSAISFCIFLMCFITKPFVKMELVPLDGLGLTEALKDPWMVIHPPLVFISYSAMAILFSLYAALTKTSDQITSKLIVFWLRISWFFLGIGILSGSIWAYRALGWGGYWAWDPIENAALVPWLILCGYLHRKEYNKKSVCIIPFTIACFGVFLARSGILKDQSAHAYTDGNKIITGIFITFILGIILFLIITKAQKRNFPALKKRFLTLNRPLMIYCINGYAALIFLGTVTPIIFKQETPMAYFSAISIIFALFYNLLLLHSDSKWLMKRNILMMAVSTMLVIGIIMLFGSDKFWWLLLLWVCLMPLSLWIVSGFKTRSWTYYLSHLGVVFLIVGAIGSTALGKGAYIIVNPVDKNDAMIEGLHVPLTELYKNDMLIKMLPTQDLLIHSSNIITTLQGNLLIPYTTKPLIILFWIGSFFIIAQPFILILSDWFTDHPSKKILKLS